MKNSFKVLVGDMTWVSYFFHSKRLPPLKKGFLAPNGSPLNKPQTLPANNLELVDYWYAKDYDPLQDISILLKNYRYLGS